jgi:hypothetical protein
MPNNRAILPELVTGLDRLYHHAGEPFSHDVLQARINSSAFRSVYEQYLRKFCDTSGHFAFQHAVFENMPQFNDFSFDTQSSSTLLIDRGMNDNRPYLQFPPDLATNCHTFLLRAMQGSGKTFAFAEFVRQHRTEFPTVLIVTPRQCVALQMVKALSEHNVPCCMYQDFKNMQHGAVNVCQLDSLPRFAFRDYQTLKNELGSELMPLSGDDVITKYNQFSDFHVSTLVPCDLIAMDEVEAVVDHMCSPTLISQGMLPRDILVGYIKRCKLVLAMQADLSDNVWDFLWSLRNKCDASTQHDPGFRFYWRIATPLVVKDFERVWSLNRFVDLIRADVQDGNKRIVVLSDSKTELEVYIAKFTVDWGVPLSDCLIYKADSTRSTKRTMACCNDTWVKCKYLFYSPTVSFGVDFNPDIPHFHVVYCHFNGNTVSGTVAFQMINRCRTLIDNKVFFYTSRRKHKAEYLDLIARNGPCIDPSQALVDLISDRVFADSAYRSFVTPLHDISESMPSRFDLIVAHAACRRAIFRGAVAAYEKQYRFLHELMNQIRQFGSRLTHDSSTRNAGPVTVHVVTRNTPTVAAVEDSNTLIDTGVDHVLVAVPVEHEPEPEPQPELEAEEPQPETEAAEAEAEGEVPHKKRRRQLLDESNVSSATSICDARDLTEDEFTQLSKDSTELSDDERYSLMRYQLFRATGYNPSHYILSLDPVLSPEEKREMEISRVLHIMDVSGFSHCAGQCVYVENMAKLLARPSSVSVLRQAAHVDSVVAMMSDQTVVSFKALLAILGINECQSLFDGVSILEHEADQDTGDSRVGRAGEFGRSLKKWRVPDATWDAISNCCVDSLFPAFAITTTEDWIAKSEQNYYFVLRLLNKTARRLFGGQANVMNLNITGRKKRKLVLSFSDRARDILYLVNARQ